MTAPMLESYVAGRWFAASDDGARIADAVTGETVVRVSSTGLDVPAMLDHARTVGGPALRELTFHQRAGPAQAARAAADGRQGRALRAVAPHRRHRPGQRRRHRRRLRHRAVLRQQGQARAARRHRRPRRRRRAARQARHLRRPAPLDAAARGGRADQRLQLPGVGLPREVRARLPRRRPDDREAGQPDRVPDRGGGPEDRRVGAAARGVAAAAERQRGRRARLARRPGPRVLHRLGRHRPQAAQHARRRGQLACGSTPRPTRSTARSSGPTPRRTPPSSGCSSTSWSPR